MKKQRTFNQIAFIDNLIKKKFIEEVEEDKTDIIFSRILLIVATLGGLLIILFVAHQVIIPHESYQQYLVQNSQQQFNFLEKNR